MSHDNEKIKQIEAFLEVGLEPHEAIQRALDTTLTAFAAEIGKRQVEVSMCLRKTQGRVYPEIRQAIADRLGVPREFIDKLIDSQPSGDPESGKGAAVDADGAAVEVA